MPSLITHMAMPCAIRIASGRKYLNARLLLLCVLVSVLPDADVIAFKFGIPYASQWGHRGFMHSILFALCISFFSVFFSGFLKTEKTWIFVAVLISSLSHPVFDAFTDGGLGVALLWPFSDARIFFPWHPIKVSPIGIRRFFSERGLLVLKSEFLWIWLPSLFFGFSAFLYRLVFIRIGNRDSKSDQRGEK